MSDDECNPNAGVLYDYFPKFFRIKFKDVPTSDIDGYEFHDRLKSLIGGNIERIEAEGKNNLIVKISKEDQYKKIITIKKIIQHDVEIEIHDKLSYTQGLIYLNSWGFTLPDDKEELENYLKKKNPGLHSIEHASFIKTNNERTLPIIVNYLGKNLPTEMPTPDLIPVRPWINKPLRCRTCQEYGHSYKKCKPNRNLRCEKCSEEGHSGEHCQSPTPFCFHCREQHIIGHTQCMKHKEQKDILDIQHKEKVGFLRARQIYKDKESSAPPTFKPLKIQTTKKFFKLIIDKEQKKKLRPWVLEKAIEEHIGEKPESMRDSSETSITVEIKNPSASKKMPTFKGFKKVFSCEVEETDRLNPLKGIATVFEQNISYNEDWQKFRTNFIKYHKVKDVEKATWIKNFNRSSTPLMITFYDEVPKYMDIPKEKTRTKVQESVRPPLLCKNCQEFGHGDRSCEKESTCGRCGQKNDHLTSQCDREPPKCCLCGEEHLTGAKNCIHYKQEQQIIDIQTRLNLKRTQAKILFDNQYPDFTTKKSYAQITNPNLPPTTPITPNQQPNTSSKLPVRRTDHPIQNPTEINEPTQTNNRFYVLNDTSRNRFPNGESIDDISKAVDEIVDATITTSKRNLSEEEETEEYSRSQKNIKTNHHTSKERPSSINRNSRSDQPRSSGHDQSSRSRSKSNNRQSKHETPRNPNQSREKINQTPIKPKNSPPKKKSPNKNKYSPRRK